MPPARSSSTCPASSRRSASRTGIGLVFIAADRLRRLMRWPGRRRPSISAAQTWS
jgi:hypothetical protein